MFDFLKRDTLPVPREKLLRMKNTIRDLYTDNEILRGEIKSLSDLSRKQNSELIRLKGRVRSENNADALIRAVRLVLRICKEPEYPPARTLETNKKNLDSIDMMLMEREI
jgi:hypothetical protein